MLDKAHGSVWVVSGLPHRADEVATGNGLQVADIKSTAGEV
ncbi:hypothetical protein P5G61_06200 [Paenibacillus sp. F6_3S_P_1C]|uniref:Uncharacterized protein n=1 Tax=Paenibacillus vandeheii TaxID=3035917 RepID=A0ABT8J719_9BACL|nr:hypothetical protein [Paenibacillus vandeheii]MDN4600810.1 hypothetical protein [Paenibacillus vandeheii]